MITITSEGLGYETVNQITNVQPDDAYQGPGVYRHYKGGLYEVDGLAIHESDLSCWVVYKSLREDSSLRGSFAKWWLREYREFNETVDATPRFTLVALA